MTQGRERKADIIVVGGGAAGMMAAGQAAGQGARVVLLEKMKRTGLKIGISGKGRCNLTNVADLENFLSHFGKNGRFLRQAFHRFFAPELIGFFEGLGLPLITERGGRVFPESGRALDVVKVLRSWLDRQDVRMIKAAPVTELLIRERKIAGVACGQRRFMANTIILATGGASYPATGSSGDGYRLARQAGHAIVPIRPALVPLETETGLVRELNGLHLRNIGVRLRINGKTAATLFGELKFYDHGLTGPVILTLSLAAVDGLRAGNRVEILLDLKPALDQKQLDARLCRDLERRCHENMESVLRGLLPRQLVQVCLRGTGIQSNQQAGQLPRKARKRLGQWLKRWTIPITGHRGLDEAIVTAGGVRLAEIDPRTMQSRLCTGLYIAGELLDLAGDTGGYNLQAAFSTGWLAGQSARSLYKGNPPKGCGKNISDAPKTS